MKNNLNVGVFDSGIGGLTVLKKLTGEFSTGVNFHYFADTARVPYGSKPIQTLRRYISEIFDFFYRIRVDAIVTACNTSDSVLTQKEKNQLPVPYFSIIDPTVKAVGTDAPKNSTVAVIATSNTVKKSLYLRKLFQYENLVEITQKACPLFVPLVEEGIWEGEIVKAIVKYYLSDINRFEPDYLVLGCTHYPFIRKTIESNLSSKTKIIDPADHIISDLGKWLEASSASPSSVNYYVSGETSFFQSILQKYLGHSGTVKSVNLTDEGIVVRG